MSEPTVADPMIEVFGVRKAFGETKALNGVDLQVPPATVLGLLGPNGAGKTTTVGMLTTRVVPTSGTAVVGGIDVRRHPSQAKALERFIGRPACGPPAHPEVAAVEVEVLAHVEAAVEGVGL